MVKEKTEKCGWQFVFLSADLAVIGDAMAVGMDPDAVLHFQKDAKGTAGAWASLSARTSDFRSNRKKKIGFRWNDRKHPDDPPSPWASQQHFACLSEGQPEAL
jgi:hypothetical protein